MTLLTGVECLAAWPIRLHTQKIDVTRTTHKGLDVLQEKRIDDYWNVDSSKHLSDSWQGFTEFTLLKEKRPKGDVWSG